jgi:hypothetical protein
MLLVPNLLQALLGRFRLALLLVPELFRCLNFETLPCALDSCHLVRDFVEIQILPRFLVLVLISTLGCCGALSLAFFGRDRFAFDGGFLTRGISPNKRG